MSSRIEQHSPTRIRLLCQPGAKRDRPLLSRAEIVGGEIKMHDRRPRPVWGNITLDLLRNQDSPGHLDPDARVLGPQLTAPEQPQIEVGKALRFRAVQRDAH